MTTNRFDKCGNCGCARREHFQGTGLCDLGFCMDRCKEFVEPA